ncbi:trimeric intracellular cation channel family protein [Nitrosomonas sp. Is37]|uniref:trimeric intracellular cation channel family protein n=1 Tax=Nitrosomonas sp. Is37 TaxID=3080535 RepID=UPI00294B0F04|nr:trimeric intracellular cation channel family protein [Nitrosomonas sp. Is37]MDV6345850.1 trimeric intracellular cation channel family protein [Nitrosomonas sp. Is37]
MPVLPVKIMDSLLHFIDVFGTFIFALSGAVVGVKKNYDVFGVFVISLVTAVGGGVIRDICISSIPPAGLITIEYLIGVFLAIIIVSFFQKLILSFQKPSTFFDAIGLGFFAAFGANKTYQYTGSIQLSIILGCASAVGGGVFRDILTGKSPSIFTEDLYASAAIIGSLIELMGATGVIDNRISIWASILTTTTIRMLAIKYKIKLPSIKNKNM